MEEFTRAVEATLFASAEPLSVQDISDYAGEGDVDAALADLQSHYSGRGIEVVERGGRWHFQTARSRGRRAGRAGGLRIPGG